MDHLLQDLRFASRSLAGAPALTGIAVLCLSVGIGMNSAIFTVVDALLIRPLPFQDAERLVVLNGTNRAQGVRRGGVSYQDFVDWRERSNAFVDLAASTGRSLTLSDGQEPERYRGATISWRLFPMLGVAPAVGRTFREDEDRPGAAPVLLLSDDVWRNRYAADPSIVGRSVMVNGVAHTVIGVMPPRFHFPFNEDLWVPLAPYGHDQPRDVRPLQVMGRTRPGVDLESARASIDSIAAELAREHAASNAGWGATARPLRDIFVPDQVRLMINVMMGAVTIVLLIVCANIANLLLARATVRQREISLRAALGAGRGRIVRQLLTEALLLSLLAVPPGIALAYVGSDLLERALPRNDVPYLITWDVEGRTLLYAVVVAMLTGIVFGLAPAVQALRTDLVESLKEGARGAGAGGRRHLVRNGLVVAEVGLALVLLVGASLFIRSFLEIQKNDGGLDTRRLMTMRIYMPGDAYVPVGAKARRVDDLIDRIEALPGVEAAAASNLIPLDGGGDGARLTVEGRAASGDEEPVVLVAGVTPHFARTLGVPVVQGRAFTRAEADSRTPVAIINQKMAARYWGSRHPVGGRFRLVNTDIDDSFTVVGVVRDFHNDDIDADDADEPEPSAYVPYRFQETLNTGLVIRVASGDPAAIVPAVRTQIRAADPSLPVFNVETLETIRQVGVWQYGLFGWMFGTFGAVALLLAVVGVYGVLAYNVSQRTQEIGIRVALGAGTRDVIGLVLGQGARLAAAGTLLGLAGAFGVTRIVASVLYDVSPTDPVSFGGIAALLIAVALVASYVPARRAVAVDPVIALRRE